MTADALDPALTWPQPLVDPDSAGFWRSTGEGVLSVCRCQQCRAWMHPPLERCRHCAGPVAFKPVSGQGVLHTWIVVNRKSVPGPEVPYLIGVAELAEDDRIRISGVLRSGAADVRIGMRVTIALEPVPGGTFVAPVILPGDVPEAAP